MSRKSTLLALAAAASLGAFALSSSGALAFHASGSGVRIATANAHVGGGLRYGAYRAGALKIVKLPPPIVHPPHHWHWHWYWGWHHRYWFTPVVAGGVGAATYATATPATNRCNCLTKEYTPEGAVVFKDVCTNEMAMNPPAGPTTGDATQPPQGYAQPQQQGYLQPQTQTR